MTSVRSAPLATAMSAMRLNRSGDRPVPDTRTTSSSGPLDSARVRVGTAALTASPTSTYAGPATSSEPNSAAGSCAGRPASPRPTFAEVSKPTKE
jgi:hypothetical protein